MSEPRLSRRTTLLLAVVAAALVVALGIVVYGWAAPMQQRSPQLTASSTSGSVGASPSSPPSASPGGEQVLSGGDLGTRVPVQLGDGSGWLTITAAHWTDHGEAAPPTGQRYLVVYLSVECTKGSIVIDGHWLRAKTSSGWTGPGYGPALSTPLRHHLLTSGQRASGEVGFVLPSGAATIGLLDQDLASVAEWQLSAP